MSSPPDPSSVAPSAAVRRATCTSCLRPLRACICSAVRAVRHETEVLILQHPLEEHQAKGSARLLQLCLAHCRLAVGEQFDAARLDALLHAPWPGRAAPQRTVLLYPPTPGHAAAPLPPAAATRTRLVVIDGTWRKSRKMLHLHPALAALPRLSLDGFEAAYARLRRAQRPGQLSTLEATAHALARLEESDDALAALLHAFDGFIALQQAFFRHEHP